MAFEKEADDELLEGESLLPAAKARREVNIIRDTGKCICPRMICDAAKQNGTTCQKIFEQAFATISSSKDRLRLPDYYARAVFVSFINQPRGYPVPSVVKEYCARLAERSTGVACCAPEGKLFCMGCMLPNAQPSLFFSYAMLMAPLKRQKSA